MILTHLNLATKLHFRLLEKTSPKASAKKALSLWLTPDRYKPSAAEKACLQRATIKRVLFQESAYQSSLETYYTQYVWGSGPPVLLVHNWGGAAAQLSMLASPLVDAGFQVIGFDALGHGDSPGRRTDIVEFIEVVKDVHRRVGDLHAIVAFSLGAVAAVMAANEGVKTQRLVLVGAAASMDYYLKKFTQAIDVSRQTMGRISTLINATLKRNIKDFSIINIVPALGIPGMIVHDKRDHMVDYIEAIALSKLWPNCELHLTEGIGHQSLLRHQDAIFKIVSYLKQPGHNGGLEKTEIPAIEAGLGGEK